MKINWRIAIALVVMVAATLWVVDSVRTRYYSGDNLTFEVGRGLVTVTNPADEPAAVQLTGTGARTFTVASESEGVAGTSVKQGTGRDTTQLFDFTIPSGVSSFTVVRGTGVNFVANTDARFTASVEPLNGGDAQTIYLVGGVVLLGAAFFIYRTIRSDKLNAKRKQDYDDRTANRITAAQTADSTRGRDGRAYSDS